MLGTSRRLAYEPLCSPAAWSLFLQDFATRRFLAGLPGAVMGAQMLVVRFSSWFCAVLLWLLAVALAQCLGLRCKEHEYPFGDKCCKDCAPGEWMTKRCTATTETACAPCKDEFFSTEHNHNFCRSCTVCNGQGSREVKRCEKTSDRICTCLAGYAPLNRQARRFECSPCREGFYSTGGNESCRPWTNCSVLGKETLRAGTKAEDAVCSSAGTAPAASPSVTSALLLSTTQRSTKVLPATLSPSRPSVVPFVVCPDKNTETNWGSLSLILICLVLLVVSGMSILLLIIQSAKRDTKKRPCRNTQQEGPSFSLPIQEEQIDSNSSLIKN